MKHEMLKLYVRIYKFALQGISIWDDLDFWTAFFGKQHIDEHAIVQARNNFVAEKCVQIYNKIFNAGLMPDRADVEDGYKAVAALEPVGKGLDKSS